MWRFIASKSIRFHLALAFICLTFIVSATLLIAAGNGARHYFRDQLRQRLMAVAATGALSVDSADLDKIQVLADEKTATYAKLVRQLRGIRDSNPGIRYVYILRMNPGSQKWRFVADADEDPRLVSHVGDKFDDAAAPDVWQTYFGPAADQQITHDRWGSWLSGYAPIKDPTGSSVALLGVDMSANNVLFQDRNILYATLVALLVCLALAAVIGRMMAGIFSRPIIKLAEATQKVAQGDFTAQVAVKGARELKALAESFNHMTHSLYEQHEQLVALSNTDFLTKLHNHCYFQDRLRQETNRALRYRRPLSLVVFNIDHFRTINNIYGHHGGDDLLQQLAHLLQQHLRENDIITRYGGEEFAVIMPETNAESALETADRLRRLVQENKFIIASREDRPQALLTVSGGVASLPVDSGDKDGLVMAVELAVLRAKSMSRNRVCRFAEGDLNSTRLDPAQIHKLLQDASLAAVESLAQALDARDYYTRGHSENVTRVALAIAQEMNLPKDAQTKLRTAALLHDIGKIGVPDQILNKKGSLTHHEMELIRSHPSIGAAILAKAPMLADVIPVIIAHHERYDGKGYPTGLAGERIPQLARVLTVADSFDAMISFRPYRDAMSIEQALEEIRRHCGIQFDPEVVAAFERIYGNLSQEAALAAVHGAACPLERPAEAR